MDENLKKQNERLKGPTKSRIFVSIGLALIIIISFFGGYFTHSAVRGKDVQVINEVVEVMDKVGFIYDPVTDEYVKLEGDKMAQLIAGNFLDGYSAYYTKEEYQKILAENSGEYVGIGVTFSGTDQEGSNQLIKVALNSPAHNAGLCEGDKIVGVRLTDLQNPKDFTQITTGIELSDFMKGIEKGQNVDILVDRAGEEKQFDSVKKDTYYMCYVTYTDSEQFRYFSPKAGQNVNSVDTAFNTIAGLTGATGDSSLGEDVAVVTLSAFEGDAAYQLGAIIKYMVDRGRSSLILDLCGNGGGDMKVLTDVASFLIKNKGEGNYKIVCANEKLDGDGSQTDEKYRVSHFAVENNNFNQGIRKISVMADRGTASASECLIGAMIHYSKQKDNDEVFSKDNLVIVGSQKEGETEMVYRTYGKGIMQTTYRLQSGGALKLTTAKITWPDEKTCIHKVGITPSLPVNGVENYSLAYQRAVQIAIALPEISE